jgi:hypothetical protein
MIAWQNPSGARDETRPDQNAVCAEHKRGSKPATVSHAARRDQNGIGRMLREIVGGLGHEREQAPIAAVTARLATFGDDDIGTRIDGFAQVPHTLKLTDQRHPLRLDAGRVRFDFSEGEH